MMKPKHTPTIYSATRFLVLILLISLSLQNRAWGQDIPNPPSPPKLVVDHAGILTPGQQALLEQKLVKFNDTTSNQILVFITPDLYGYDVSELADRIGDKWGVGQSDIDNGIVIVVKPNTAGESGQVWISVGYGLEGAIPDITAGQIIDHEMIPNFKRDDYYSGLDQATTVLMELAAGEYTSDEYARKPDGSVYAVPFIIFFILMIIIIIRKQKQSRTIGSHDMSPWTAIWLGSMLGSSGRGGWGGSSGGSFGGGAGFGGFGGGGFGGGGAGGSW